ncbi:hypothetical protein BO78DRAFT_318724, partial [Aspergillus sclerotiicarbonarius CBS 121057]
RVWRTGLPVRSAVLKPHAGRLVVGWVTTSESLLLYVFALSKLFFEPNMLAQAMTATYGARGMQVTLIIRVKCLLLRN